ncbi:PREDICTED: high-affinity nitrate transporter-activating protein 2.1-like [Nelumbo nucifera]|uniref:High-affinity nitrate transporter n=2 Tax=Nelumbo nucifera TaxID=4432 RepID=A0A1U7ZHM8_NELNU|nr:PREDICTED: high-affinity nitrate transporter-activating protein 2.1-like [Nelumbo nucifera]
MAPRLLAGSLLTFCLLAESCYGTVLFSTLQPTLVVSASPKEGEVLRAGDDKITVTWGMNQSFPVGTDEAYKQVKVKLCYAPISQQDRAWRKTNDDLSKDKTCQFQIIVRPYNSSSQQSFDWMIERDVPTATYFVRAYAYNSDGREVAFGQSTDGQKKTNLFDIQGISGRHASLDVAAGCFSAFSVLSLFGFLFLEKRKAKTSQKS